jgi:hypothetical protein
MHIFFLSSFFDEAFRKLEMGLKSQTQKDSFWITWSKATLGLKCFEIPLREKVFFRVAQHFERFC